MKNLLSCLAVLSFAAVSFGASAAGPAKVGDDGKVRETGRVYRVHGVLRQNARLVRASAVMSGGRAGRAAGSARGTAAVVRNAAFVDDASDGYDVAALSTEHHVRCLIAVEQADAEIYIDGRRIDGVRAASSPLEVDWDGRAMEQHTLSVRKEGMASFEQTFSQGVGDAAIYVKLLPLGSE